MGLFVIRSYFFILHTQLFHTFSASTYCVKVQYKALLSAYSERKIKEMFSFRRGRIINQADMNSK